MSLEDQLRVVLDEAGMRTAPSPDLPGLIAGGRARRRRRNARWIAAGVLAALVLAVGTYGMAEPGDRVDSSRLIVDLPAPRSLPVALEPVPLDPGTYLVEAGAAATPYTATVPAGWAAQHGTSIGTYRGRTDPVWVLVESFGLDAIRLTDDTCRGEASFGPGQTTVAGLVAGLRRQGSGLRVGDPVADTLGGQEATRIDLDYPGREPLDGCRLTALPGRGPGRLQVWSGYFVLFPRESASVYVVEVGDHPQVVVTRVRDGASAEERAQLSSILASITFRPGSG